MSLATAPVEHEREKPYRRSDYRHFQRITTRWIDNDAYGHVNNIVYLGWFDTVVNAYLIESNVLDVRHGAVIGFVVETQCRYHAPLAFPQTVEAGLRVQRLGTSSVRYEIGIFAEGSDGASADGHLVHVYVDRQSSKPAPLPAALRTVLQAIST
ncbi:MAG: acyl-CoA thioesterase [Burkholderiaceae bacterium]|nr:acyl-CoA thioesterase [Burkholderiaceae bacterium]